MPLNRKTVLEDIRATNPELYQDWDDELILGTLKEIAPDIEFEPESEGAAKYRAFGSQIAPGFVDRSLEQLENQWQDMKSGISGALPFTSVEAAESYRKYNENLYKQKIADNVELQALTAWKEQEPGWSGPDTYMRSLSEALPSLAISIVGGVVGAAAGTMGAPAWIAGGAALAPMFAMEGGAQYNEAMSVLVDEVGLDPEEARGYARVTALAYGSVSSILERLGAKHYLKMVGIPAKQADDSLLGGFAKKVVENGLDENFFMRMGRRGLAASAKTLEGTITEGTTEFMQAYTQNTINEAMRLGFGEDEMTAGTALQEAFKKTWNNPAVWEEGFAGATTGIIGFPGGFATPTQAGKVTTEDIAKMQEQEGEQLRDAEERPESTGSLVTDYFNALVSENQAESMAEVIESLEGDDSPLATRISNAQKIPSIGQKILEVIGNNSDSLNELLDHSESGTLLSLVKEAFVEQDILTGGATESDVRMMLSQYAKTGSIEESTDTTGDVGSASNWVIDIGVPTDTDEFIENNQATTTQETKVEKEKTVKEIDDAISEERKQELIDEMEGVQSALFEEDGGTTSKVSPEDKKKAMAKWKDSLSADEVRWIDAWTYLVDKDTRRQQAEGKIEEAPSLLVGDEALIEDFNQRVEKKNKKIEASQPQQEKFQQNQIVQLNVKPENIKNKNNRKALEKLDPNKQYKVTGTGSKLMYLKEVDDKGKIVDPKGDSISVYKSLFMGKGNTPKTDHLKVVKEAPTGPTLKPSEGDVSQQVGSIKKETKDESIEGDKVVIDGKEIEVPSPTGTKLKQRGKDVDIDEVARISKEGFKAELEKLSNTELKKYIKNEGFEESLLENDSIDKTSKGAISFSKKNKQKIIDVLSKSDTDIDSKAPEEKNKKRLTENEIAVNRLLRVMGKTDELLVEEQTPTTQNKNKIQLRKRLGVADKAPENPTQEISQKLSSVGVLSEDSRLLFDDLERAEKNTINKSKYTLDTTNELKSDDGKMMIPNEVDTALKELVDLGLAVDNEDGTMSLNKDISDSGDYTISEYSDTMSIDKIDEVDPNRVGFPGVGEYTKREARIISYLYENDLLPEGLTRFITPSTEATPDMARENNQKVLAYVREQLTGDKAQESADQQFLEEEVARRMSKEAEGLTGEAREETEESIRKELQEKIDKPIEEAQEGDRIILIEETDDKQESSESYAEEDSKQKELENERADAQAREEEGKETKEETTKDKSVSKAELGLNDVDFQDTQQTTETLISDDTELANTVLARLKKHFPFVDTKTFEGVLEVEGSQKVGFATESLVAWSTTDATIDTLPHEYAHIYVKLLRNDPLIKKALKQFKGNEEALVQAMADYYMGRIRDKGLVVRMKKFLKQLVAKLKRVFGVQPNSKQEVLRFISEEFYQGKWLGIEVAVGEDFIAYQDKAENDVLDEKGSTEDQIDGDQPEVKQTSVPTSVQMTHFMHDVLGVYIDRKLHYPQIMQLASDNDTYESYEKALFEWAKDMVQERNMKGDENLKTIEDAQNNTWMRNKLKQEWSRVQSRIPRLDINLKHTGRNTRVYLEIIQNADETDGDSVSRGMQLAESYDKVNQKAFPEYVVQNFVEQDYENEQHDSKLMILPLKQIMKVRYANQRNASGEIITDKDGEPIKGDAFYVSSGNTIDIGFIKQQQKYAIEGYYRVAELKLGNIKKQASKMAKDGSTTAEVQKYIGSELEKLNSKLISIIGSKLGDGSSLIATSAQLTPDKITPEIFNQIIEDNLANNNIREEHAEILRRDGEYKKLKSKTKNLFIQSESFADYFNTFMEDSKSKSPVNDFFKQIKKDMNNNRQELGKMSQALAQLQFWQDIRTPDYFMYEKSAGDTMIRLSIDMAEGPNPIEAGDMSLMIIDEDVQVGGMVWERDDNGEYVYNEDGSHKFVQEEITSDSMTYGDMDGASLTGTRYLSKVGDSLGYNVLQQVKTFIRQRDVNNDGSVDYIGMKHMQFAAYKGMKFYKDGRLIAEVKQNREGLTYFEDVNGNKFDMIASPNEAKMTFGKYASTQQKTDAFGDGDYENGFYKVHKIKPESIKVTQVLDKSKMSASHPIALGELLLSIGYNNAEVSKVLKEIRGRYVDVANHYTTQINDFYKHPEKLAKFVKKMAQDGEVPDELQKYIRLIEEEGYGVFHPAVITHILPTVNSKLIKDGINKVRGWDGNSSVVYIKPSRNKSTSKNAHVQEGNIILSADNKVARGRVKKIIKEKMGNNTPDWKKMKKHEEIKFINDYLSKNNVHILIHRNPIAKVTGPVVRRVQALEEGLGQTAVLSEQDVKSVLDGDWDGDKTAIEFTTDEHTQAMLNWQNSEMFATVDNVVSLLPFGQRIDKAPKGDEVSSILNRDTVSAEIWRNSKNDGTTGIMMNGRTILSQLFSKEFSAKIKDGDSQYTITAADPSSQVTMNYINIDENQLTSEELGIIYNNNDSIVSGKDGRVIEITKKGDNYSINETLAEDESWHLQTTKAHEMATLFQMAVDGSKFPFLGQILENVSGKGMGKNVNAQQFMISRIFQRNDDTSLEPKDLAFLGKVYASQNLSRQRGGRTKTGLSTDFGTNISMSKELDALHNDNILSDDALKEADVVGTRTDKDFSERFANKVNEEINADDWKTRYGWGYSGHRMSNVEISMKNRVTPMEALLLMLGRKIEGSKLMSLVTDVEARENAHIYAIDDLVKLPAVTELMNKAESEIYSSEDGIGEFTQAYNFLYSKNVESHIPQDSELKKTIERYLEDNGDKALNLVGIWDILMELNKDKTAIRADMNQTYVDFTDLFLDKWNTLTPEGQGWATLQFLKGFGNHVHVLKLLPADLMSDNILSNFLPIYEKKLRNIIDAESTPEDLPSWHYAKNMTARDKRKNPTPYRTSRKELQKANKRLRENSITHRKEQKENNEEKFCKRI